MKMQTPTLCRLCVIDTVKGRVIVARGTVFPSNSEGGNMIHNNPVTAQNVRVSVDNVVPEFQLTPLPVPCSEHETVGNAEGSFVQWPKELVILGQVYIIYIKVLNFFTYSIAFCCASNCDFLGSCFVGEEKRSGKKPRKCCHKA